MSFFNTGAIRIVNTDASSVTINAPATGMTSNYNFTLPPTTGTNNYILKTDGTGATEWVANSSGAPSAAPESSVIFTDGTDLSGVSTLIYDSANTKLTVLGDVSGATMHSGSVSVVGDVSGANIIASSDVSGATMHAGTVTVAGDISGANIIASSDVSGATMHAGTVTVAGNISGANIIASSDVSGATMHAGSVTAAGDISGANIYGDIINNSELSFSVDACGNINSRDITCYNLSVNNTFSMSPTFYDNTRLTDLIDPKTIDASNTSIIVFDLTDATTYDVSFNINNLGDGQTIKLFYISTNVDASVAIDFGANTLLSGSGNARTLTFNSHGQSADLTYLSFLQQIAINNVGGLIS